MMNTYQQSQQQQNPPLPPNLQAPSQVSGYQQYGSAMQASNNDGMISYPTAHLYTNNYDSSEKDSWDQYYACAAIVPPQVPDTPPGMSDPVTKAVVDNILGKLPTKKNQLSYRCDVCDQEFYGRAVLDTHLAGAKHAKKMKSVQILNNLAASGQNFSQAGPSGNLRCEACGIDANSSQQLQTHLAGNKHKQRMLKLSVQATSGATSCTPNVSTAGPVAPIVGPAATEASKSYSCEVCGVHFNSQAQMQQHMESRKHKEKEAGKHSSNKHHPYRRGGQVRFQQSKSSKKRKQPLAFLTPLSSSFVPGSML